MNNTKKRTHYYMIGGVHRLESMKDVQEFIGSKSKTVFKSLRQKGFIDRIEIGTDYSVDKLTVNGNK